LTVSKLISLANIYNIPAEELLHSIYPESPQPLLRQLSTPNATILLTEGPLEEQAKYLIPDAPFVEPPDETQLLPLGDGLLQSPYRRGIIGKRDRTLEPMIPPGSIVHFDSQQRAISSRKDWTHEFKRPIYFLMTRGAYVCGWCELDKRAEWLTRHPAPAVTGIQSEMEVPDRSRKPGTRGYRGDPIDRIAVIGFSLSITARQDSRACG
jgi:hypothetical protein